MTLNDFQWRDFRTWSNHILFSEHNDIFHIGIVLWCSSEFNGQGQWKPRHPGNCCLGNYNVHFNSVFAWLCLLDSLSQVWICLFRQWSKSVFSIWLWRATVTECVTQILKLFRYLKVWGLYFTMFIINSIKIIWKWLKNRKNGISAFSNVR